MVQSGWYPDPLGLPQLRWWDGQSWTEHTSDARRPSSPQVVITTTFADPADEQPAAAEPVQPVQPQQPAQPAAAQPAAAPAAPAAQPAPAAVADGVPAQPAAAAPAATGP